MRDNSLENTANQEYIWSADINYRKYEVHRDGFKEFKAKWKENINDLNKIQEESKWYDFFI